MSKIVTVTGHRPKYLKWEMKNISFRPSVYKYAVPNYYLLANLYAVQTLQFSNIDYKGRPYLGYWLLTENQVPGYLKPPNYYD